MAKCATCRKAEALETRWDRAKSWLMRSLFPRTLMDFASERYNMGFGDGYKTASDHNSRFKSDYEQLTRAKRADTA